MCKKLFYLVSFVLVLSSSNLLYGQDPSLVLYFSFDDEAVDEATDHSQYRNNGTIEGSPQPVAGQFGSALMFDATDDQIIVPTNATLDIETEITMMLWARPGPNLTADWRNLVGKSPTNVLGNTTFSYSIRTDNSGALRFSLNLGSWQYVLGPILVEDTWYHITGTYDGTQLILYVDGESAGTTEASGTINVTPDPVCIGNLVNAVGASQNEFWSGVIDEVRIWDRALGADEVTRNMAQGREDLANPMPFAWRPEPADGAMHESTWVTLSWSPGDLAVSHDVYLGDNPDDVNDANRDSDLYRGSQAPTFYVAGFSGFAYPGGLDSGTTYYWRIDEVNDTEPNSPWKGDIWSFWIPPKKAYEPDPADGVKFVDPNITLSWTPGNGAILHTVYFGDSFDEVNNAVVGIPQAETTYRPFFGPLELDKTYYWRVDEFDGVETHKGDVLSFTTKPVIPITDPNLVGWWTFDEAIGNNALDWSGYGHDGKLVDDPQWVDGYDGGALKFDGSRDIVEVEDYTGVTGMQARTCAAWFKTEELGEIISWGNNTAGQKWIFRVQESNGIVGAIRVEVNGGYIVGSTDVRDGQWHHAAAVLDDNPAPDVTQIKLYLDGELQIVSAELSQAIDTAGGSNVRIGQAPWGSRPFTGLIDDVRIYDYALTAEEVKLLMRGDPLLAWDPSPPTFSLLNLRDAGSLSFSPGDNASQHDVYFGTDKDAVSNADVSDSTGVYRGRQGSTSYNATQDVEWGGGPYYWRIDEVNTGGTVSKGRIWNFTVADFIVIDDFESYNDLNEDESESNRIYLAWIDGFDNPAVNGSVVGNFDPPFAEQTIVHGGSQSMPFAYDNAVGKSEATSVLTSNRDWTENGVATLVIWYIGDSANAAETMYVVLNGTAGVDNDNPNAAQIDVWTEWRIDLLAFAEQGVNLANVNNITIGFGNRSNPVAGGTGMVFFDDIRLYRQAP